jgi:hypothetical protein
VGVAAAVDAAAAAEAEVWKPGSVGEVPGMAEIFPPAFVDGWKDVVCVRGVVVAAVEAAGMNGLPCVDELEERPLDVELDRPATLQPSTMAAHLLAFFSYSTRFSVKTGVAHILVRKT